MINIRKAAGAALASSLLLVLPASALAHEHGGAMGDRGHRRGDVPSRIANKLRSAERAMQRAQEHADDAEPDASVAALAAVRRHLASATKSVGRRVSSAGNPGGPAAAAALARTQGDIVEGTVGLFDGAPDSIVAADAETLKAALDGRDALVAGIAALTDHSGYGRALKTIARDAAGEAQDIAETLTDDTLTDARQGGADGGADPGDRHGGRRAGGGGDVRRAEWERDAGLQRRRGARRLGCRRLARLPPGAASPTR